MKKSLVEEEFSNECWRTGFWSPVMTRKELRGFLKSIDMENKRLPRVGRKLVIMYPGNSNESIIYNVVSTEIVNSGDGIFRVLNVRAA